MMILKGNNAKRIGWKDAAIERLRELVNNDQQDTLQRSDSNPEQKK